MESNDDASFYSINDVSCDFYFRYFIENMMQFLHVVRLLIKLRHAPKVLSEKLLPTTRSHIFNMF